MQILKPFIEDCSGFDVHGGIGRISCKKLDFIYIYIIYIYISVLYQLRIPENDSKLCHGSFHFKEERLSSSGVHPRNRDEISVFCFASGPEECA